MSDPVFNLKTLQIPTCWHVLKNDFIDLEPDNDYPINEVFYHFDEDILFATYNDFSIDLGFYSRYINDRNGFFKIVVSKGDFNDGVDYEIFISRSTDQVRDKLNFYFKEIPLGLLENTNGIKCDDNNAFIVYSAIDNINYKLTDKEIEEISKPKKEST